MKHVFLFATLILSGSVFAKDVTCKSSSTYLPYILTLENVTERNQEGYLIDTQLVGKVTLSLEDKVMILTNANLRHKTAGADQLGRNGTMILAADAEGNMITGDIIYPRDLYPEEKEDGILTTFEKNSITNPVSIFYVKDSSSKRGLRTAYLQCQVTKE